MSHFLDRSLVPHLVNALKPNGLLIYQTFTREKLTSAGPNNPDRLLSVNELLHLFAPLRVLVYREEGRVGNIEQGFRSEAYIVAQRVK